MIETALIGRNGSTKSPAALFRGNFNSLYVAATSLVSEEDVEAACYLAMCEACLTFDPDFISIKKDKDGNPLKDKDGNDVKGKKVTFRTYAVGQMRDRVKDLIKNQGIKKPHLPQVEIVEFDVDEDNPDAIAEPLVDCRVGESDLVMDQMKLIENILPRHVFDIFARWYGISGRTKQSQEDIATHYQCSLSRVKFVCDKSFSVIMKELVG